jgi:hypothetical protein
VRYLWCATNGWLITRSDFHLIQVSEPSGTSPAAERGVS